MNLGNLDREQKLALTGIVAVILGIVVVPPMLQRWFGVDAIHALFVIIVIYAGFSLYLKRIGYASS